jgi:putative membrane protein
MTRSASWLWYGALLAVGAALYVTSARFPAHLPVFLPWEFHWPEFLTLALTLAWFARGLKRVATPPPLWRQICFVAGVISFYVVLQTRVDYYAQHMFFVHRWAHFILHHAGAFAIAMGMSGPTVYAGMPDFLKPVVNSKPVRAVVDFLQHPVIAPLLFVGLLYFWLIPSIHTYVMLDAPLYELMNWSMAINGVMFWSLILDCRPKPPARLSSLVRAFLILVIELPQMVLGAILSLSMTDYYPVYTICGRVLAMTALNDQHYGGLIIWLPGTLTSFAAMITVLVNMRLNEERAATAAGGQNDPVDRFERRAP